jgi:predicted nucleic acid-binding Zn ribbon protein
MKIATTNCSFCEAAMPMGAAICSVCGREQKGRGLSSPHRLRMLIAIVLSLVVLIAWNWLRAAPS